MKARIMCHIVPWFPDHEKSLAVAIALAKAGAAYLEVQFPYSDPTADGPAIQGACTVALQQGFTVEGGFAFIRRLREQVQVPIFVMCYAAMPVVRGVASFCEQARAAGVQGLIVPDLPFDYDEGLYAAAAAAGLSCVPVVVAGMEPKRLERIVALKSEFIYAALRAGITGKDTVLGPENERFLEKAAAGGGKVLAGFGISRHAQVKALTPRCDAVVVGSHFVRELSAHAGLDAASLAAHAGGLLSALLGS